MEIMLRPALPLDIPHIVRFILLSSPYLREIFNGKTEPLLLTLVRSRWSVFSWRYITVAEVEGHAAGMLLGYTWQERSILTDIISGLKMFYRGGGIFLRRLPLLWRLKDATGYVNKGEFYVSNVAVSPEYRGKGIGRTLMGRAIEAARQRGAKAVALDVEEDNLPAIELYRKLGFIKVDFREININGNIIKFLRMVKPVVIYILRTYR